MKIGIYQPYWGWVGGGQHYAGVIADILARNHSVEIIHHRQDFSPADIQEGLELDFSRIGFRFIPEEVRRCPRGLNPLARLREERDWCAAISQPYDLFINSSDIVPIFCHAPKGVLITHFPFVDWKTFHGHSTPEWRRRAALTRVLLRVYHALEWNRRFATYHLAITNSHFSQKWLRTLWGIDARVVYPSGRFGFAKPPKSRVILSVSRFQNAVVGNHKRHDCLIQAFKRLCDEGLEGCQLILAGALREIPDNLAYVQSLKDLARDYPVQLRTNVPGQELRRLFESAAVFWHATGYGVDRTRHPGRMEHFGIVTTEAMVAGCVPIVFNGGGQPEIVRHEQDGFLWNDLDELVAYTRRVFDQPPLLAQLSRSAGSRATEFSREAFERRFLAVIDPLLRN